MTKIIKCIVRNKTNLTYLFCKAVQIMCFQLDDVTYVTLFTKRTNFFPSLAALRNNGYLMF